MRADRVGRARASPVRARVEPARAGVEVEVDLDPEPAQHVGHDRDVGDRRDLVEVDRPVAQEARHELQRRVLGAGQPDGAAQGAPPRTRKTSVAVGRWDRASASVPPAVGPGTTTRPRGRRRAAGPGRLRPAARDAAAAGGGSVARRSGLTRPCEATCEPQLLLAQEERRTASSPGEPRSSCSALRPRPARRRCPAASSAMSASTMTLPS
jgi:hypothetical protein